MKILSTKGWEDYELLDSGSGLRLERFGKFVISRPDPQAIWKQSLPKIHWENADAKYQNNTWVKKPDFPQKWEIKYKSLKFYAKLTPFKHTGVFPEQSTNWDFIEEAIKRVNYQSNMLNLFAYTGIASLVAASNNTNVTHLDASKPSILWAKENQALSGLQDKPVRFILDDAITFVKREERRGVTYDGIIIDPPIYGHGPKGEVWSFNKSFPILLQACRKILSEKPVFIIVNTYTISSSSLMLYNMLQDYLGIEKEKIEFGELALEEKSRNRFLSTGIFARYPLI